MPRPSPVNFWLLLAATICVDAIAMVWKYAEGHGERAESFFIALVFGQLSAALRMGVVFEPSTTHAVIRAGRFCSCRGVVDGTDVPCPPCRTYQANKLRLHIAACG